MSDRTAGVSDTRPENDATEAPPKPTPVVRSGKSGSRDGGERPATYDYDCSFDRLRDIIDETFGMQPVMGDADALTFLGRGIFRLRQLAEQSGTIEACAKVAHKYAIHVSDVPGDNCVCNQCQLALAIQRDIRGLNAAP